MPDPHRNAPTEQIFLKDDLRDGPEKAPATPTGSGWCR